MKNTAKMKGQTRHGLGNVASLLTGLGIASTTEIESVVAFLDVIGVPRELVIAAGLLVAAGMHFWSWYDKAKTKGEGDEP